MSARLTDTQRQDRALSEREFRDQVDDLARQLGWESMHVDPLRTSGGLWRTPTHGSLGKGWPDTTYVRDRDRRLIFVEFKRELGTVAPEQLAVLDYLNRAGLEAFLWRPSDFDRIVEVLR